MIGSNEFKQVLVYVRRTGVPQELEEMLRPAGNGGRPRALSADVLITAMLLTYLHESSLLYTRIHHTLTEQLARADQARYGVRPHGKPPITVNQVRYLWNTIADKLDFTTTRHPELDEVDRGVRQSAMQALMDKLTGAASTHLPTPSAYAIDLSAIEAASRPRRYGEYDPNDHDPRPGASADPDARFGYRTQTYNNKTKSFFGYQMLAAVGAPRVGGPPMPLLIDRIVIVPGNENGVPETIGLLDRLTADDRKPDEILSDRGFSYARADRWARLLRERGIKQVMDIHSADRGARLHAEHGYIMIDGSPHCPSTPQHLINITRPKHLSVGEKPKKNKRRDSAYDDKLREWKKSKAELDHARALIAERAQYRFKLHGWTSAGNPRFVCPARAGSVVCRGCPLYPRGVPEDTGVPEVTATKPLPRACAANSVTIAYTVEEKLRQELYWLSDDWIASYARRSRVEAAFGLLKGWTTGAIRRGWTHQVGLVRTSLLLAIGVAASNLHQLLLWAKSTDDTRDEITQMDVTCHGFAEYDENGNLPDTSAPPDGR